MTQSVTSGYKNLKFCISTLLVLRKIPPVVFCQLEKEEIRDTLIAMSWAMAKTFWRRVSWPDLVPKISQDVDNECPLKVRKFQLAISSRLAIAHEKPEGWLLKPLPPLRIGLIATRDASALSIIHEMRKSLRWRVNQSNFFFWSWCLGALVVHSMSKKGDLDWLSHVSGGH